MEHVGRGSDQGPGWFPDPWGVAQYRWWDGASWTGHIGPLATTQGPSGRLLVRATLLVTSALLWVWAGIWIIIFPAMLLSDADNGRFSHDLYVMWLPEFGLSIVSAVACLLTLKCESNRPRMWKVLAVPAASIVAVATLSFLVLSMAGG